ncbi:MAG: hypothetical protein WC373_01805 [Smithella sp.]|jgi:hypothetical protein
MYDEPEIPFSTWTRQPGFSNGSFVDGSFTVQDSFVCSVDNFILENIEEAVNRLSFNNLYVSNVTYRPATDPKNHVIINLTYSRSSSSGYSTAKDGVPEYSIDDSGIEIPIDAQKNDGSLYFTQYRTCHNYMLAAKTGQTTPPWWSTATDRINSDVNFRWIKEPSELPGEDWVILKDKTKRIESVPVPSPVVNEKIWYQSYSQACAKKRIVGAIVTPPKTFGESGEWMVVGSAVDRDGKRWVCHSRFQNAPEWDSDYLKN